MKIKIFELITSIDLGGAENLTFTLTDKCNESSPDKFEFIIIEIFKSNSFYSLRKKVNLKQKGIRVLTLSPFNKRISLIFSPLSLLYLILTKKPNIVHSHTDLPDFVLSIAIKLLPNIHFKIIRTIHNIMLWTDYQYIGKFVESSFYDDHVIGVSKAALNAYKNLRLKYELPISPNNIVIYNGCLPPKFLAHNFNIIPDKINIAFCGRFVEQKGIDILIQYIPQLEQIVQNKIFFHIIGDGTLKESVITFAASQNNVIVYKPVNDLSCKIYDFDYLIMPSRYEGLPLLSIESSLSFVPVIASRAAGLDETLPINWPLTFSLDNFFEFSEIFNYIISDNIDFKKLISESNNFACKYFSTETMVKEYLKIYKQDIHL